MLITREEMYLAKMAGKIDTVPVPITRREQYLAYLGGMNVDIPAKPIATDEYFLAALCGQEVPEISPVTRVQAYMAGARTRTLPSFSPITREEGLWACYINSLEPTIIYKTASGPVATLSNAVAAPLRSLRVGIDPVQDLHGYNSPWPAGGGANKLLPSDIDTSNTIQSVTATWSAETEELTLNGTNSGSYAIVINFPQEYGHIKFPDLQVGDTWSLSANLPAGSYIGVVYKNTSNTEVQFWYLSGLGTFKKDTRAVPNDFASFQRVQVGINPNASFSNAKIKIAFESGSGSSAWTPYSNICPISGWTEAKVWVKPTYDPTANPTATIQLGQTVYGGTLDVTRGVLVVDRAMVDLGTLNWSYNTTYAFFPSGSLANRAKGVTNLKSDLFKTTAGSWSGTPLQNAIWGNGSNETIYVQIPPYDNVADFVQLVAGHQLVYELATPITIPLTPTEISTLQGTNNVWADCGPVDVEYPAYADDSEGL